jgi:hypothetical protein
LPNALKLPVAGADRIEVNGAASTVQQYVQYIPVLPVRIYGTVHCTVYIQLKTLIPDFDHWPCTAFYKNK